MFPSLYKPIEKQKRSILYIKFPFANVSFKLNKPIDHAIAEMNVHFRVNFFMTSQ